jgi:hypothetical protein
MFDENTWQVGPAWHAALHGLWIDPDYGPTHQSTRTHFELFAILGDPALVLPHESAMEGIPTVSEWGLVFMTLLLLTAGTLVYARRRGSRVAG